VPGQWAELCEVCQAEGGISLEAIEHHGDVVKTVWVCDGCATKLKALKRSPHLEHWMFPF